MANERGSHGVQEEDIVDEAAVVALSSLPARHIDALDVKVASLGIFLGWSRYLINWRDRNFRVLFVVKLEAELYSFKDNGPQTT
jgi:hypothetical protein